MGHLKTFRNPRLSLFQTMVEDVIVSQKEGSLLAHHGSRRPDMDHPVVRAAAILCEARERGEAFPQTPPPEVAGGLGNRAQTAWTCIKLAGELFEAKLKHDEAKIEQIEDDLKYSNCDPGWAEVITDYLKYFGPEGQKRSVPYVRYQSIDDFVLETLTPGATVALIGDWGSGTEEAVNLLEQVKRKNPDVVIHLGDIYYSGTKSEVHRNFLDVLNETLERDKNKTPVYALAGNHDLYSGGEGFYQLIGQLNPAPPFQPQEMQPASYFCLRTTDRAWQFLAMDTGLHDHDPFEVEDAMTYLDPAEVRWHLDKLAGFPGRTVLLSHHQLFSAFEEIGKPKQKTPEERAYNTKLLATFREFQKRGDLAAWFWGHEHNLCIYESYGALKKGRCIGHGAVPVFVGQDPYKVREDLENPPQLVNDPRKPGRKLMLGSDGEVYCHGYAIIKLDDKNGGASVAYYQETDEETPMYVESI